MSSPSSTSTSSAMSSSIQVAVRLRPMNEKEKKHGTLPVVTASTQDKTVTVIKGQGARQARSCFSFDNVFTAFSTQGEVFDATLKPMLDDVMQGYEGTVFAYGQTGTGKTHTMEGDLSDITNHGVIPRSAQTIFETLQKPEYTSHSVTCSYLEIYNEDLGDLFAEERNTSSSSSNGEKKYHGTKLEIMEGKNGTFCRGLTERSVSSAQDVLQLMQTAQHQRKIGETKMNKHSSRSHCIFTIKIDANKTLVDGSTYKFNGKLHMVDLAGSECAKTASLASSGAEVARERERMNINRSLLTLGRVIKLLKEQSESRKPQNIRIPYRDSKLTRILQESLGGRCKTLIVATLSPSITAIEESISTLNYAQSANGIVNKPVATSYLSINSSVPKHSSSASTSSDTGNSEQCASVQHWHEMECRLQYMQTQVEEAQAALARKHIQQEQLKERTEQAEKDRMEMEHQYFEVKKEVNTLTNSLKKEKEEKEVISLQLKENILNLKKTKAILEATQRTEVNLTREGELLLSTLRESLQDGDELHRNILERRECDVQRKKATKQFLSSSTSILDEIVSTLEDLSQKQKDYHESMIRSAQDGYDRENQALTQSVDILADILSNTSQLSSTMKTLIDGDDGISLIVPDMSSKVKSKVEQTNTMIVDGDQNLSDGFKRLNSELQKHSSHLQTMDDECNKMSDNIMRGMSQLFSDNKALVSDLVSSMVATVSKVSDANTGARNDLSHILKQMEMLSSESSGKIQQISGNECKAIDNALDTFAAGIKHCDDIQCNLNGQTSLVNKEGSDHVKGVDNMNQLLQSQHQSLQEAQKTEMVVRGEFLKNVMSGVQDLVQTQLENLSQNHLNHLGKFSTGNEEMLQTNEKVGISARNILSRVSGTTSSLLSHIQSLRQNDSNMKEKVVETKSILSEIQNVSTHQKNSVQSSIDDSNKKLIAMAQQDSFIKQGGNALVVAKDQYTQHLDGVVADASNRNITELSKFSRSQINYTTKTILPQAEKALVEMEKPRKKLVSSIGNNFDSLLGTVDQAEKKILHIAEAQRSAVNETAESVVATHKEFTESTAQHLQNDMENHKDTIVTSTQQSSASSSDMLTSSMKHASSTKETMNNFGSNVIECNNPTPPALERKTIDFDSKLSSTPSDSVIIQGLILETEEDSNISAPPSSSPSEQMSTSPSPSIESATTMPQITSPPLQERSLNTQHSSSVSKEPANVKSKSGINTTFVPTSVPKKHGKRTLSTTSSSLPKRPNSSRQRKGVRSASPASKKRFATSSSPLRSASKKRAK